MMSSPQKDVLLDVKNLTKIFRIGGVMLGTKLTAVDNVSLSIKHGEPKIISLVGESGCGKSTLAKMILRIEKPTKGEIFLEGRNIWKLKGRKMETWFRKSIQPIFQNPLEAFNPLKRTDNYLFSTAMKLHIAQNREEVEKVVDEALLSVGLDLERVYGKFPQEFSGGELQRISIARALIPKPKIIIADEPVSNVDASIRINIVNLFLELKEKFGINFIYITHDLSTAYYISDLIAVMFRGSIVEYGPAHLVMTDPIHPYTKTLLESLPEIGRKWEDRIKLSGMEIEEFEAGGCKFSFRCPNANNNCKQKRPPLVALENERKVACWRIKG